MSENSKTSKHFEPGESVYYMSTGDPRVVDWYEAMINHYDVFTDQYVFLIEGKKDEGKSWRFCTFSSPDKLFKTKQELFHACESYCREREAYWRGKAVEFSKLSIENRKEN